MNDIHSSDTIFATVTLCGRQLYNFRLNGMTSTDDILLAISRKITGSARMLLTLIIRNSTKGWTTSTPLLLNKYPAQPTQLSFNFA